MSSTAPIVMMPAPVPTQARRRDVRAGAQAARYIASAFALAAGYLLLDAASSLFWLDPVPVKPWNPQAGLAVALLCAAGIRFAPAVFVGALLSEMLLRTPGHGWVVQLVDAVTITGALALIAHLLRMRGFPRSMASVTAMRDFFVVVGLGALVSSIAYVGASMLVHGDGFAGFTSSAVHKWLGDVVGIAGVTPLVLLLIAPRGGRAAEMPPTAPWLDVLAFALLAPPFAGISRFSVGGTTVAHRHGTAQTGRRASRALPTHRRAGGVIRPHACSPTPWGRRNGATLAAQLPPIVLHYATAMRWRRWCKPDRPSATRACRSFIW